MKKMMIRAISSLLIALSISSPSFAAWDSNGSAWEGNKWDSPLRWGSSTQDNLLGYGNLTFFEDYSKVDPGVDANELTADYSAGSGSATFTATRSSTTPATYIDRDGVIRVTTTSNVPRYTSGFYDSTGFVSRPGLIVEGAGTNLALDSYMNDGTTTPYWTNFAAGGTVTNDTTYTNPYGGGRITKLVANTALQGFVNNAAYRQNITSGTVYTASVLMRGSGDVYVSAGPNGGTLNYSSKITLSNSWKRYSVTFTSDFTGGGILGVRLQENQEVTAYIATAQLEALPFASTFIPTTTAALTRNPEILTYPIASNRTAENESIFVKYTPYFNGTDLVTDFAYLLTTDTKERTLGIRVANDNWQWRPNATDSSGASVIATSAITSGVSQVIGLTCDNDNNPSVTTNIYINGASEATNTTNFTANAWGTNFVVGSNGGGTNRLWGIIQSLAFFSDAKSATDVANISELLRE